MARDLNRNSYLTFFVIIILILILAIAFTARAQVSQAPIPLNFMPPVAYDSGAFFSSSIAVGDLNGDGKLDIVVTNSCLSYNDCPFNDVPDAIGHPTVVLNRQVPKGRLGIRSVGDPDDPETRSGTAKPRSHGWSTKAIGLP